MLGFEGQFLWFLTKLHLTLWSGIRQEIVLAFLLVLCLSSHGWWSVPFKNEQWAENYFGSLVSRERLLGRAIQMIIFNDLGDKLILNVHRLIILEFTQAIPLTQVLLKLLLGRRCIDFPWHQRRWSVVLYRVQLRLQLPVILFQACSLPENEPCLSPLTRRWGGRWKTLLL